ncbi:hypothetical protein ABIE26_004716 [Pedobacter africanus]|uniref:Uncharacterized protein n=1 Tax=Pedobacter africanus TaxID=151894 RepID=A0ACC6L2E4_9SPHI|nr:hypothetical protein [Pedobacter africanus]
MPNLYVNQSVIDLFQAKMKFDDQKKLKSQTYAEFMLIFYKHRLHRKSAEFKTAARKHRHAFTA